MATNLSLYGLDDHLLFFQTGANFSSNAVILFYHPLSHSFRIVSLLLESTFIKVLH